MKFLNGDIRLFSFAIWHDTICGLLRNYDSISSNIGKQMSNKPHAST